MSFKLNWFSPVCNADHNSKRWETKNEKKKKSDPKIIESDLNFSRGFTTNKVWFPFCRFPNIYKREQLKSTELFMITDANKTTHKTCTYI